MSVKIKAGGKTSNLQSSISEIRVIEGYGGSMELWIFDKDGNDSLTYLTMDEACALIQELKLAIKKRVDLI